MRKIYFYESNPEHKVWEKTTENVEGKIISETPWKICERQNGDTQRIRSETNEIKTLEMMQ